MAPWRATVHDAALIATALARSWSRHRGRAIATFASGVIGILMVTMVVGVVTSILTAVDGGTGLKALKADLVVGARSTAGFDQSVVDRVIAAAEGAQSASVTFANTRIAGDQDAVLTVIGLEGDGSFVPGFSPAPPVRADERSLQLTRQWAQRHGLAVGDRVELSGPRGSSTWTVGAVVDGTIANAGAVALAPRASVQQAFDRTGTDAILLAVPDAQRPAVADRLGAATGGSAIVGTTSEVINPEHSSFAQVRQILLMIGAVGLLTAGTVLFVCWRLLIEDERETIARLRLVGARPRALIAGAGGLFLALALMAAAVGVPLGLAAAGAMTAFARTVVSFTGLAASPQAPGLLVPGLAGIVTGFLMAAAAWLIGLRSFLKVPAVQAVRGVETTAPRRVPVVALLAAGVVLVATAVLASYVLPERYRGSALLPAMLAVVLLATVLPVLAGTLLRRRDGFTNLAAGRELASGGRKRSGTIAVLGVAIVFSIGLFGLAATLSEGLRSSVEAWTKGDLFVLPAQPGVNLRDEKFPVGVPEQLEQLRGVQNVVPFSYTPFKYEGRNVQLYAWGLDGVAAVVDLNVAKGVRGDQLWSELGNGNVAVSDNFAWLHDLEVGDALKLPAANGTETTPRIVATIEDYTGDTGVIFTSYDTYTALSGDPRSLDLIVTTDPQVPISEVRQEIHQALGAYPGLTVWTGSEMRSFLLGLYGQVLAILQAVGLFCLLLAILLGVTTSVASVSQRRLSVGLSRLIGNTKRQLSRQLAGEATTVGVLAWLIAFPVGLVSVRIMVFAVGSQSGTFPPVQIPWLVAGAMVVPAVFASAVAVLLPSRRLLKVDIAETVTDE